MTSGIEILHHHNKLTIIEKIAAFLQLLKFRLSFLVVFSGGVGYMLALSAITDPFRLAIFLFSAFLITGAANIINQVLESDVDSLMTRTQRRPIPTGRISLKEAIIFAVVLCIAGVVLMASIVNTLAAVLTLISAVLYAFVYTPLKRRSSFAVIVGALPGAFPPLIGWVAATGTFTTAAFLLFVIQFIWQFPHFWAIAWVLDEDYKKAGFKLLPFNGSKDIHTAFHIMICTLLLIPFGIIPTKLGLAGNASAIIITSAGILFLLQTFNLMRECSNKSARMIMFGSFLYLPVVQIALIWDKI